MGGTGRLRRVPGLQYCQSVRKTDTRCHGCTCSVCTCSLPTLSRCWGWAGWSCCRSQPACCRHLAMEPTYNPATGHRDASCGKELVHDTKSSVKVTKYARLQWRRNGHAGCSTSRIVARRKGAQRPHGLVGGSCPDVPLVEAPTSKYNGARLLHLICPRGPSSTPGARPAAQPSSSPAARSSPKPILAP